MSESLGKEQIRTSVLRAIERVQEFTLRKQAVRNRDSAVLLGERAALDSLGLVKFAVALEDELARITDQPLHFMSILVSPEVHATRSLTVDHLVNLLYHSMNPHCFRVPLGARKDHSEETTKF